MDSGSRWTRAICCVSICRTQKISGLRYPMSHRVPPPEPATGDPTRLRVATALLSADELCVCDLAWVVGLAQNLVSHHLRLLKGAGLVTGRRQARLVMPVSTPSGHALVTAVLAIAGLSTAATTTPSAATVQGHAHG